MTCLRFSTMTRLTALVIGFFCSLHAYADWYYYVLKVSCSKDELRVIDYSAYNEEGVSHASEAGVINVDNLSTWKTTPNDLNVPDKPLPYKKVCTIPSGKYEVVLTNEGGGYSAPYPIINVREISDPKKPKSLINNLSLEKSFEYSSYEIVFSSGNPYGNIESERISDEQP